MAHTDEISTILLEDSHGTKEVSIKSYNTSKRKLFLFGEIDSASLYTFAGQLMVLISENPKEKIELYINSPGGSISDGLAICDLISQHKDIIDIYCMGIAYSMGSIILSCGKEGHRFIYPHSKVMIHEPLITGLSRTSATSLKDAADSILKSKDVIIDLLVKNTKKSKEEIEEAISFDNYMSAEEAIEFHIADKIVDVE